MNETVTVDGRDAVVRVHRGRGPTLVLVHGAGGNHHYWDELLPVLGGIDLVAPSLPGRCGSGGEPFETVADMAAWLRTVLCKLGRSRVVVAGHSLGGAVALEHAIRQREEGRPELAGLVLLSSGARLRVSPIIFEAVDGAIASGMPADLGRLTYGSDTAPEVVERVERDRRRTPPETERADWTASHAFDRMEDLGRIDAPTLVLAGAADALTPLKYARYLEENIGGARLEVVEGGGHMLPVERPREVGELIRDFVAGLRP